MSQAPEGAIGRLPLPGVVRMSGECAPPGFILSVGKLNAAENEADEGYFTLGQKAAVGIQVVPYTPAWQRLMQNRGQEMELVIRPYVREQ